MKINEIVKNSMDNVGTRDTALIAFLGDSVTQGCFELYKNQKNGGFQTEFYNDCGYHTKLKSLFDTIFPRASVSILNAGISGDYADNGAKRVKKDVIARNPDLAIVCYGLNDVCNGRDAVNVYTDGLRSIFRQLKSANIDTIFMTPNMVADYPSSELEYLDANETVKKIVSVQTSGTMDLYMENAIKVCEEEGIPVCDCYSKWKILSANGAEVTRLLSNRLNHPTEKMHWLFAWSLFETIFNLNG